MAHPDPLFKQEHDVVIVGAGLSGLTAAYRLHQAGLAPLVLESAGEVGGRTRSRPLGGEVVEFGAEWLGRRHVNLGALLGELGIASRPARQLSFPILWRGPGGSRLLVPTAPLRELAAVPRVLRRAAKLARAIDPCEPWRSPAAHECDRLTFGDWLRSLGIRRDGYYFFDQVIGALSSTPIARLSLLHVLWWIARGGGPLRVVQTTFERNIPAGAQAVAEALAARLGGRVVLDAEVRAIRQSHEGVEVDTSGHGRVHARRAIVTAPLGMLGRIGFEPGLAPELAALDQLSIDPGTKAVAHLSADQVPIHRMFVGGQVLSGGWRVGTRITGFAPVPAGNAPEGELLDDLARGFGVTAADLRTPAVYRWSEHPSLPGCDVGFAPGQISRHGPHLRRPHGLVHFAGAERSSWPNNMEGAVESGTRVAHETMASLSGKPLLLNAEMTPHAGSLDCYLHFAT